MDIFGRQDQILMGGLSSDSMFMTFPEIVAVGGGLGLLIQNVRMDYRQPIRRIFEIGPGVIPNAFGAEGSAAACDGDAPPPECAQRAQPTYYIIGRPEGRVQFGRIIGPNVISTCFYRKYGSPCGPNVISMGGRAGCSAGDPNARRITWTMNGVTLDTLGLDVTGQEMVMQENISAMFAGLNMVVDGDDLTCGQGQVNQLTTG